MATILTKKKAREILSHGEVHGKPLTPAQRRFFGARASGEPRFPHIDIVPNLVGQKIYITRIFCRIHAHSPPGTVRGGTYELAFAVLRASDGQPIAGVVSDLNVNHGGLVKTSFVEREWRYEPGFIVLEPSDNLIVTAFAFASKDRLPKLPMMRFGIFAVMGYTKVHPSLPELAA